MDRLGGMRGKWSGFEQELCVGPGVVAGQAWGQSHVNGLISVKALWLQF